MISDLLCALGARVSIVTSAVQGMACVDPLVSLSVFHCVCPSAGSVEQMGWPGIG